MYQFYLSGPPFLGIVQLRGLAGGAVASCRRKLFKIEMIPEVEAVALTPRYLLSECVHDGRAHEQSF